MNNISQTKEGFIKSMVLFVVLLVLCFAPFFAFAQNANQTEVQTKKSSTEKTTAYSAVVSEDGVVFELNRENQMLNLTFKTGFACTSYVLEARMSESEEFKGISYCNNQKCANAVETVSYRLSGSDLNYSQFRIKAQDAEGHVYYSESKANVVPTPNEVELINTAANDQLFLRMNATAMYSFNISSINGEIIRDDEQVSGNSIKLSGLEAGFYIISFKGNNGNVYHYKFFKTINL